MVQFSSSEHPETGYLCVPQSIHGPGILVLHAWWGLNDFFEEVCNRIAREGFVALAPDLYQDKIALTVGEADRLGSGLTTSAALAMISEALSYLKNRPEIDSSRIGVLGFSMGGTLGLSISDRRPNDVAAIVDFYGTTEAGLPNMRAPILGHFGGNDDYEPLEAVRRLEGRVRRTGSEVLFHIYPGCKHWFFEDDRPEFDSKAAALAWKRTTQFLHVRLG